MNFETWLTNQYIEMAGVYRSRLSWVTSTVAQYCTDEAKLNAEQVGVVTELLNRISRPTLGKFPGTASDADKAYYHTALKPDFADMLREAIKQIKTLANE